MIILIIIIFKFKVIKCSKDMILYIIFGLKMGQAVFIFEYSDGLIAFDSSLYPQKFEEMTSIVEQKTSKVLKNFYPLSSRSYFWRHF